MLEPEVETRPWASSSRSTTRAIATQLAYLFERSRVLSREAGRGRVRARRQAAGGLAEIARLPLTEKRELKATCTPENPIGAHLCATPARDRPHLLDERHDRHAELHPAHGRRSRQLGDGSARSYAASGVVAGQRIVSTYNAGPFVAGAALAAFDRIGLCHIPVGTGNTERLMLGDRAAPARGRRAHAVVRRVSDRVGGGARRRSRGSSVERVLVAGEPGGGEPAFRAKLEEGWGARVTEAMGIGDIGVSLWGECEEQDGMHLGARGFVHAELIDPETGAAVELADGAAGRARAHASPASRGAAAALPHARPRPRAHGRVHAAGARARACAASGGPTTCSSSAASTSSRRPSARS